MESTEVFCPAKINLFLSVTGRRADGFHNLLSLMAPLELGDRLTLTWHGRSGIIDFSCTDSSLPTGEENLVIKSVRAFSNRHPLARGLRIHLQKNVPAGAGLGGGSSDAAGTLIGLNRLCGQPLPMDVLRLLAAEIGSDCPFFLHDGPAVARGRGERLEIVSPRVRERLLGLKLLLCKPFFGISTARAFGALARRPDGRLAPGEAERRLAAWSSADPLPWEQLLHNDFEAAVFEKYIALGVMKSELEKQFGCPVLMSGSGSTLFAILENPTQAGPMSTLIRECYGPRAFVSVTTVMG